MLREGANSSANNAWLDDIAPALDIDVKLAYPHHPMAGASARSLQPVIIPPSFPLNLLLPVTPVHESPSSSEKGTETDPSSSTTTITLTGLPYTIKVDIRPVVFQRFVKV
jgi:hypothetical protein